MTKKDKQKNQTIIILLVLGMFAYLFLFAPQKSSGTILVAEAFDSQGNSLGNYNVQDSWIPTMAFTCTNEYCTQTQTLNVPSNTEYVKFNITLENTGGIDALIHYRPATDNRWELDTTPDEVKRITTIWSANQPLTSSTNYKDGNWGTYTECSAYGADPYGDGGDADMRLRYYVPVNADVNSNVVWQIKDKLGKFNRSIPNGFVYYLDGRYVIDPKIEFASGKAPSHFTDYGLSLNQKYYSFNIGIESPDHNSGLCPPTNPGFNEPGGCFIFGATKEFSRVYEQGIWWFISEPQEYAFLGNLPNNNTISFITDPINVFPGKNNIDFAIKGIAEAEQRETQYNIKVTI